MKEDIEKKVIDKEMSGFVVIGLGRFGRTVAKTLAAQGKEVLVVDTISENVKRIEKYVSGAVVADATGTDVLHSLGVQNFDCVVNCIGDDLQASILTTLICKDLGVKYIVAKAQNDSEKISFGNIKTPEFKARLLIACMEAEPPMKTLNAPELNDEFLSSIDSASAQRLRELRSNAENQDGFYAQRGQLREKARNLKDQISTNVSGGEEKTPKKGSHQTFGRIPQRFRGDSR